MISYLLNCTKKEFHEHFKKPDKDKNTGLYVVPTASPAKEAPKDLKLFTSKV